MRMAAVGGWVAAFALTGCGAFSPDPCMADEIVKRAAGASAVDCGTAVRRSDAGSVHGCTVEEFGQQHAFHARFDRQGLDSEVVDYRANTPGRGLFFYRYDSDPSGGGNAGARLSKARCVDPRMDTDDGGVRMLSCGSFGETMVICQNKQRPTE